MVRQQLGGEKLYTMLRECYPYALPSRFPGCRRWIRTPGRPATVRRTHRVDLLDVLGRPEEQQSPGVSLGYRRVSGAAAWHRVVPPTGPGQTAIGSRREQPCRKKCILY